MKKAFALLCASLMITGFVACGQSEDEKKNDSLRDDSVTKETQSTGDSLIEMMERENEAARIADSIAAANADTAPKK